MSVQFAAKIHLAETPPLACSSCGTHTPDRRFVDFGAAWDGPMVPAPGDIAGAKLASIDDLVVCEECLTAAAGVLGLEDVATLEDEALRLERECVDAEERLAAVTAHVDQLTAARTAGEDLERLLGVDRNGRRSSGAGRHHTKERIA